MHKFLWLDDRHVPDGTLEGGVELANRLYWNLTWAEGAGTWHVWSGERLVLEADSREVAEAFLYGIELAYGVFPDCIFKQLEREVTRLVAPEELDGEIEEQAISSAW